MQFIVYGVFAQLAPRYPHKEVKPEVTVQIAARCNFETIYWFVVLLSVLVLYNEQFQKDVQ